MSADAPGELVLDFGAAIADFKGSERERPCFAPARPVYNLPPSDGGRRSVARQV